MKARVHEQPVAARLKPQADIVFCVDVTGSMQPCIEGVKANLRRFIAELEQNDVADYRLSLIAYRDLHDPTAHDGPWLQTGFVDASRFRAALDELRAQGGGDYRGAESTLDALYRAVHAPWRPSQCHKTIVLFTDDHAHPTLHPDTYGGPDNHVGRVLQDWQRLNHTLLYMVAPEFDEYRLIYDSLRKATGDCRVIWDPLLPTHHRDFKGVDSLDWSDILQQLGYLVSQSSLAAAFTSSTK